jgi:hypothetical protein
LEQIYANERIVTCVTPPDLASLLKERNKWIFMELCSRNIAGFGWSKRLLSFIKAM